MLSAESVPASATSSLHHFYNRDEVDRFMAAVQTVENFAVSCMSTDFGINVNRKYVGELVGIFLHRATAAVEQLTANIVGRSSAEKISSAMIEETKQLLMSIVEHAATLRDCMQRRITSQISTV